MQITISSHTKDRKLYVDAISLGTVLAVAFETDYWWVVDAKVNGLRFEDDMPFVWIPKDCAREVDSTPVLQSA